MVARAADQIMEAIALATEDKDAVAGEVELVVVRLTAFVEADDPEVLLLQLFEGADEVDHTSDAEVFGGSGAGFDGNGADRCGAAFSENDAIDSGAVSHAQQRAKILRIFDAVESEHEASRVNGTCGRREKVFDGERFLRTDKSNDALVRSSSGELSELFAGLLANANTGFAASGNEAGEALVVTFASNEDLVKAAAARLERLLDRMHAVENFHDG
jgi:hypothetical protein